MVIVKAPKGIMKIPGKLAGLSQGTIAFSPLTQGDDFEEFMDNAFLALIAAYPFKDLGKPRTKLMSNSAKMTPELLELELDDFDKYNPRDYLFTERKYEMEIDRLLSKMSKEPVGVMISALKQKEYLDKIPIDVSNLGELTMKDLSNERKVNRALGYRRGVGVTGEPKGTRFDRDKFLLDKFDKGEELVNLVKGNKLFNAFMDNISVSDNEITINVEEYIKEVMSQHGYYDDEKDEWQFEIKEVEAALQLTEEVKEKLRELDEMMTEDSEAYTDLENKTKAMEILNEIKDDLDKKTEQEYGNKIRDYFSQAEIAEEEALEAFAAGEGETTEKMLKSFSLTDQKTVGSKTLNHVEVSGEYPEDLEFTLHTLDGKEKKATDADTLFQHIEENELALTYADIEKALLVDKDKKSPLRDLLLSTITPEGGKLQLGVASVKYQKSNWLSGGEPSHKKFLQALKGMHVGRGEDMQVGTEWNMHMRAILFLLGAYEDWAMKGFQINRLLDSYSDDKELVADLKSYRNSLDDKDSQWDLSEHQVKWDTLHNMEDVDLIPFLENLIVALESGYKIGGGNTIPLTYNPKGNMSFQFEIQDLHEKYGNLGGLSVDAYNMDGKSIFDSITISDEAKETLSEEIAGDRSGRELEPVFKTLAILNITSLKQSASEGKDTIIEIDTSYKRGRKSSTPDMKTDKEVGKTMTALKRIEYNYQQMKGRA